MKCSIRMPERERSYKPHSVTFSRALLLNLRRLILTLIASSRTCPARPNNVGLVPSKILSRLCELYFPLSPQTIGSLIHSMLPLRGKRVSDHKSRPMFKAEWKRFSAPFANGSFEFKRFPPSSTTFSLCATMDKLISWVPRKAIAFVLTKSPPAKGLETPHSAFLSFLFLLPWVWICLCSL